jgi:orotidine-5'-phosphate decarboxylase
LGAKAFADRLCAAVRAKRTPVMVGLDPRFEHLPDGLRDGLDPSDLAGVAAAYERFGREILDVAADLTPAVKFQAAFFEAAGPEGMLALAALMRHARSQGLLVVLDGKRNDIGSTAEAYARAYLGGESAAWPSDATTVNPFLGRETLDPFLAHALQSGGGFFVLVRTSNPGSKDLQEAACADGDVSDRIATWVETASAAHAGKCGYGPVGAVVGATHPSQIRRFRERMPHAVLLLPGYGAQGGAAADVRDAFDGEGLGAVVNNSRGVLCAHQRPEYAGLPWRDAARGAVEEMIRDLAEHTPAGNLRT